MNFRIKSEKTGHFRQFSKVCSDDHNVGHNRGLVSTDLGVDSVVAGDKSAHIPTDRAVPLARGGVADGAGAHVVGHVAEHVGARGDAHDAGNPLDGAVGVVALGGAEPGDGAASPKVAVVHFDNGAHFDDHFDVALQFGVVPFDSAPFGAVVAHGDVHDVALVDVLSKVAVALVAGRHGARPNEICPLSPACPYLEERTLNIKIKSILGLLFIPDTYQQFFSPLRE